MVRAHSPSLASPSFEHRCPVLCCCHRGGRGADETFRGVCGSEQGLLVPGQAQRHREERQERAHRGHGWSGSRDPAAPVGPRTPALANRGTRGPCQLLFPPVCGGDSLLARSASHPGPKMLFSSPYLVCMEPLLWNLQGGHGARRRRGALATWWRGEAQGGPLARQWEGQGALVWIILEFNPQEEPALVREAFPGEGARRAARMPGPAPRGAHAATYARLGAGVPASPAPNALLLRRAVLARVLLFTGLPGSSGPDRQRDYGYQSAFLVLSSVLICNSLALVFKVSFAFHCVCYH